MTNFTYVPKEVTDDVTSGKGITRKGAFALYNAHLISMRTLFMLLAAIDEELLKLTEAKSLISSIDWDAWRIDAAFNALRG